MSDSQFITYAHDILLLDIVDDDWKNEQFDVELKILLEEDQQPVEECKWDELGLFESIITEETEN
jgi:hypothetical protein